MKKLGIIGGLGPMATVSFMRRIIELTPAETDQAHIPMVIENAPQIPDRTAFLLGRSQADPIPPMIEAGRRLVAAGAEVIAIPCITAHGYMDRLESALEVPILNAVELTAEALSKETPIISEVGILATEGTVQTGIFKSALERRGMAILYPSPEKQRLISELIFDAVKAGREPEHWKLEEAARELMEKGAKALVLGCTELSVIADSWLPEGPFADVLTILAKACVEECRG